MRTDTTSSTAVQLLPGPALAALGAWAAQAACVHTDPEIFFPPAGDPAREARKICGHCPVRDDCLTYALEANESFGIWGGLDPEERCSLRRRTRAKADGTRTHRTGAA
jgi:WhiB family transcriptional regulator, redox-sensing transcriptional regulator